MRITYRSSITGLYVDEDYANLHPDTTEREENDWDDDLYKSMQRNAITVRLRRLLNESIELTEKLDSLD